MNIDKNMKQRFRDYGYMVVPGFYGQDAVISAMECISFIANDSSNICGALRILDKSADGSTILTRLENTINYGYTKLGDIIINDSLVALLQSLFDYQYPTLFKDKVNFKPPGCRADLIHQDQASGWSKYADYFISVCIAIDANTKHNAAMRFLATGDYPMSLITDEWEPVTFENPETLPIEQYHIVEINPGDIIVFDSYVPHGSPANLSKDFRRNIFLTFNSASKGDLRQRYYEDRKVQYPPGGFVR